MIGEIIQEYLVGLGVKIDKPGFQQLDSTLKNADTSVAATTGSWSKNFKESGESIAKSVGELSKNITEASMIIAGSFASATAATAGFMKAAAQNDLEMEKFSRRMMLSKDAAWEMKKATDALGESVSDIVITPELMERYKALVSDGQQMKPGGDFASTMKGFRDLIFEFTRLKQEVAYAMTWVGYYLIKYLDEPLEKAKATFKSFNDRFISNMSNWTQKIAESFVYIINIGVHFLDLLKAIGKTMYELWESFPRGIKIATASLVGFITVLKMSPFTRALTLIGALLLLVDDYFGYMEGKDAEFGKYWDKLNDGIDLAKQKIIEFANAAEPYWEKFIEYIGIAKDKIIEFAGGVSDFIDEVRNSKPFTDFVNMMERLGRALGKLAKGIFEVVSEGIKKFYRSMQDNGGGEAFRGFVSRLWQLFIDLGDAISYCTETLAGWLDQASKSPAVRDLIGAFADLAGAVVEVFNAAIDLDREMFGNIYRGFNNTKPTHTFRDGLRDITKFISAMIRGIAELLKKLAQFFKTMESNKKLISFWQGIGKAIKAVTDSIMDEIRWIGLLGQAMVELLKGNFSKAASLAKQAIKVKFGAGKGGGTVSGLSESEAQYEALIQNKSKQYGVDPNLVRAVIKKESTFNQDAVSPAGAIGLMQLMPGTAAQLGVDPTDPEQNVDGGVRYLKSLLDQYGGDVELAVAAYNAGPGNVTDHIPQNGETPNYVSDVMDYYSNYTDRSSATAGFPVSDSSGYNLQRDNIDLGDVNPELLYKFNTFTSALAAAGYSVSVSSGYRTPDHSVEVGGSSDDPHTSGSAIDWVINGDFNPQEIEGLASQYGLGAMYHDAGNGYHFHTQLSGGGDGGNEGSPTPGLSNASFGFGKLGRQAMETLQGLVSSSDPLLTAGLVNGYAGGSFGGDTVTTYHINVGGVTVAQTNASPDDIGQAVADQTLAKLESRGQYFLQSRALTGGPELV